MKKVIALALLFVFVMPLLASQAFAAKETAQTGIVDAGNKLCPVSGDPVSGTSFVIYQGKRYGLCCPMCEKPFLSDPEKYLSLMKANEKASASTTAAPATSESKEMEKDMEQGSL
ncbi:MAG: hypothetical protein V1673_06245 [Candidatus Omnitrophota bacterium]